MKFGIGLLFLCLAATAGAQHAQPYTGQEKRDIKALSDQEVSQYLSGAGMGYARPAELNGYPGPMHVLELADQLELNGSQRSAMKNLMDRHKVEARAIGAKYVEAERAIEALFRSGNADAKVLAVSVDQAARLQGEYRLSHLETHRRSLALLTPEQVSKYAMLRGYSGEGQHKH